MIRFKYSDYKEGVVLKTKKPQTHNECYSFADLSIEQQRMCKKIKDVILELAPTARVYLFGSQMNGRWDFESDYDIIVESGGVIFADTIYKLRNYDYGVKVDLFFPQLKSSSGKKIEL